MKELAARFKAQGILQPLVVRAKDGKENENKYEAIAGARRLRAAQLAELKTVPVRVGHPQRLLHRHDPFWGESCRRFDHSLPLGDLMFLLVPWNPAGCKASARMQGKIERILQLFILLSAVSISCASQARPALCRDGLGRFSSQFSTGITVSVSAAHSGGFATHACDATLRWGGNVLPVAQGVWEIDIDVMGETWACVYP